MKINDITLRDREEDYVNINPLQTAGKTYPETRKAVLSYIDGYSVCDWCKGNLLEIDKPGINKFLEEVSVFLGMDETMLTNGCRESKYSVVHALTKPSDTVVLDGNKHYTTYVACERGGLNIFEVESSGTPEYLVDPEGYASMFEKIKSETGKLPKLAILTHVDGNYGNVVDAKKVGKICREYGVPYLLNTAYSSGRMIVDGKKLGADFISSSGHKSWACGGGNIGLLAVSGEIGEKITLKSDKFRNKPLEILGCSTRGSATIAMMASFPKIRERVKTWDKEVENARTLVEKLESIGLKHMGEKPTRHDLNFFESNVLYEISQTHKRKNFFLYQELKKRGVIGIKAGLTKQFKLSTYGKTKEQVKLIGDAFEEIVNKFK